MIPVRLRRALAALAVVAALVVAVACAQPRAVVSPGERWGSFTDRAHGISLFVQEPYSGRSLGTHAGVWRAVIQAPAGSRIAGADSGSMEITATRLPAGSRLATGNLVEVAPKLTAQLVAGLRRRGAADVTIVQPLQPFTLESASGLEAIFDVTDTTTGARMRSDVLIAVNHGWLVRVTIAGDNAFWGVPGPALRRFANTLQLFQPGASGPNG